MDQQTELPITPSQKSGLAESLFEYVEMFVLSAAVVILLLTFFFRICVVNGPSMNQTLAGGDRLVVSDLFYQPKQGDIVVFHHTSEQYDQYNEPIVKRVIAVGGQFVKIDYKNNRVYVSDDADFAESEVLNETDYAYFVNPDGRWKESLYHESAEEFSVPEGYLFVLGDNRNNSADSRADYIGLVDERSVLGRVLFRITPFSKFGSVT